MSETGDVKTPSKRPPALVKKLAEVMAEVHRLPKTGWNERQNYAYVTESDVMDCIRNGLASRGVLIDHDTLSCESVWRESKGGGALQFATVCLLFTASDAEGNEMSLGRSYGQGQDSGEKAVYKAITGATKYKLLKQFLISSGDDPEAAKKPIHADQPASRGNATPSSPPRSGGGAPTTLPNFGKSKGAPIAGAALAELEWYAQAMRESIDNPAKATFKAKNQAMLEALEAEIDRQTTLPEMRLRSVGGAPATLTTEPVDAFSWARDAIPRAAVDMVDRIINRAASKVTTEQFAELTGLGRARKAALVDPIAGDGPGPGREPEDDAPF